MAKWYLVIANNPGHVPAYAGSQRTEAEAVQAAGYFARDGVPREDVHFVSWDDEARRVEVVKRISQSEE